MQQFAIGDLIQIVPFYAFMFIVFYWLSISMQGMRTARSNWEAQIEQVPVDESEPYIQHVLSSSCVSVEWAQALGFEPSDVLICRCLPADIVIVGWRKNDEATHLCVYIVAKTRLVLEITSSFENGSSLSTVNTEDGHYFPTRLGVMKQSFSASTASELWVHHKAALEYLANTQNIKPLAEGQSLADEIEAEHKRQSQFIRSIPFWALRIPYWYFVNRKKWHNKPISKKILRH